MVKSRIIFRNENISYIFRDIQMIHLSLISWTAIKIAIAERAKRMNSPWNSWRRIGRFSGSCHFAVSTSENRHACIPIGMLRSLPPPLHLSSSFTLSSPASSASGIISRVPLFSSIIGLIWASSDKSGALVISNRYSGGGEGERRHHLTARDNVEKLSVTF